MQNRPRLLASAGLVAGLALGWAAGCGSTESGAQATLGPAGGTLSVPGSGVELVVPPGALSGPVDVALKTTRDPAALTVSLQPVDLGLARAATLSVTLPGPVHFSGVTEMTSGTPIGLDARIESASSATARLRLDRFRQVRFSTEVADGGTGAGACHEHEDGEDHDGEHDGDEDGDGGHHRDGGTPNPVPDGGTPSMACPAGFECDDGVCVAPGGNDEHHGDCDGGSCGDDDGERDGGSCGDDDGERDGGHR